MIKRIRSGVRDTTVIPTQIARSESHTRVRLVVTGQPYWARHFVAQIRRHAADVDVFLATSPVTLPLLVVRVRPSAVLIIGYRPGAPTPRGRAFDAIINVVRRLRPSATMVRYWIGTDVENATKDSAANRLTGAFESSRRLDAHIAGAPWLASELCTLGIAATCLPYPGVELRRDSEPPELPAHFRVLSYVAEGRFAFYGGPTILAAARRLTGVQFDVVGCKAPADIDVPPNVTFLGWRTDMTEPIMTELIRRHSAVLHLTRHDGMSLSVREGLMNARHVIWTYPLEGVRTVPPDSPEDVSAVLAELAASHAAGTLRPNERGWRYAWAEFEPDAIVRRFVAIVVK